MTSTNNIVLSLMAVAALVGGFALMQTSGGSVAAEAATAPLLGHAAPAEKEASLNDEQESGSGGTTVAPHAQTDADDVDTPVTPEQGILTEEEAIAIATATYHGNGTMTEVGLENENGVQVYAVEFTERDGNEVDVKLNAKTGAVVLVESDRDETGEDD